MLKKFLIIAALTVGMSVGTYGSKLAPFRGEIDEPKIFSGALDRDETAPMTPSAMLAATEDKNAVPKIVTNFSYYPAHREKHPVITAELLYSNGSWNSLQGDKDYVKDVMEMSVQQIEKLIPGRSSVYFVNCPNCTENALGAEFDWSLKEPEVIICKRCKQSYPSAKYPEKESLQARAPSGKTITYTYYTDSQGLRYFFSAGADWRKKNYFEGVAEKLGKLYFNTGKEEYAEKAAQIICLFARAYPNWCYKYEYPAESAVFFNGSDDERIIKSGWKLGRWCFQNWNVIPRGLIKSYDRIYNSKAFEAVLKQMSMDRWKDVEDGFFHRAAEGYFFMEERYDNLSPYFWSDAIMTGRITGAPDYVHLCLRRVEQFFKDNFYLDGFWQETSSSYMIQSTDSLYYLIDLASAGYTDLPDLKSAYAVRAYTNFNLFSELKDTIVLTKKCLSQITFPDGQYLPMGDTWENAKRPEGRAQISYLQSGAGHAALCGPINKNQPQLHIFYSPKEGHTHQDGLSIVLWDHGRQLLSDHGYTHTIYRPWITGTLAHNTVCVDYNSQSVVKNKGKGDIIYMDSIDPAVQIIDVDNRNMNGGNVYRRTCFKIQKNDGSYYVADFFQVGGGSTYDYMLHGNLNQSDSVEWRTGSGKPVAVGPAAMVSAEKLGNWAPPKHETDKFKMPQYYAYGFLSDTVKVKKSSETVYQAIMRSKSGEGLSILLPSCEKASFYSGKSPRARQDAHADNTAQEKDSRSFIAMRQESSSPVVFQGVIIPFMDEPPAVTVKSIASNIMLINYGQDWDLIFYDLSSVQVVNVAGIAISAEGQYGVVSLRGGKIVAHHLVGAQITAGSVKLKSLPSLTVPMVSTATDDNRSFTIASELDASYQNSLAPFMRVNHPDGQTLGYFISGLVGTKVSTENQLGFVYKDKKCRYVVYPHSLISGETTVTLFSSVFSK